MKKLVDLEEMLNKFNQATTKEECYDLFKLTAKHLLSNYQIETATGIYNFVEIEFYFYNSNHRDKTVHSHSFEAGKWRVHYSGLDITIKGESDCYGGILIRSIEKANSDEPITVINGPLRVLTFLFSGYSIEDNINIKLVKVDKPIKDNVTIHSTTRNGINEQKCFLEGNELSPNTNHYCFYRNDNFDKWDRVYSKKRFTRPLPL